MRILVCGGRNFGYTPESNYKKKDFVAFSKAMDFVVSYNPTVIIQGGAKGGDEVGKLVAEALSNVEHISFKAEWKGLDVDGAVIKTGRYGKYNAVAGPQRNKAMLDEGKPDLVIAFPGGSGTADMIRRAKKAGVEVVEVPNDL